MKNTIIIGLILSILFPQISLAASKPGKISGWKVTEENVFNAVNKERYKRGLPILTRNEKLDAAADAKIKDMLEKKYFNHDAPDGSYPWVFVDAAGYDYEYIGENLARGWGDIQHMMNNPKMKGFPGWMDSPKHRENVLNERYTETGIAVYKNVVVQFYGIEK